MKVVLLKLCLLMSISMLALSCTVESELEDIVDERERNESGEALTELDREQVVVPPHFQNEP